MYPVQTAQNRGFCARSEPAYNAVYKRILDLSGCPIACADACTCVCNSSGVVYEALMEHPPKYCTHEICLDPAVKRAMNYPATEFDCDSVFAIALKSLYQLCGKTNGM